jgi:hypothetical protein
VTELDVLLDILDVLTLEAAMIAASLSLMFFLTNLRGCNDGCILVAELGVLLDVPDEGDESVLVNLAPLEVVLVA